MRVAFLTLGCKVNSYETEKMKSRFEHDGHVVVPFGKEADVYIVNTCTVTNIADRKSRQMLHRARRLCPDALVVATGCYVDSAAMRQEKDACIDVFVPNKDKENIVEHVLEAVRQRSISEEMAGGLKEKAEKESHTRAYVKVQDGCNQFCSYCIIPYVRGALHSREIKEVEQEVRLLAANGLKEIVVTGIHLSSYGVDGRRAGGFVELGGEPLLNLLAVLNGIDGIRRIRLGSLEPRIITEPFVRRLRSMEKICPHFHLSLQSGSDSVLKRMNRKYSTEEYLDKVAILRSYYREPAVTTDIIVGFPGESDSEYRETEEFVRKVRFAQLHVFKYSRRQGTVADAMDGQISEQEKSLRSERLLAVEQELEEIYQQSSLKETETVLLEEEEMIDGKRYMTGYNERYVRFLVPIPSGDDGKDWRNEVVEVKVQDGKQNGRILALPKKRVVFSG